jgi:hypothetical protein
MKPSHLPSGIERGIPLLIPDNWTPEQATAVFELLDDLREAIGRHYQVAITNYLREDRYPQVPSGRATTDQDLDSPF